MATKTLDDVTARLIREGELDRNEGAHSIKSLKEQMAKEHKELIEAIGNISSSSTESSDEQEDDNSSEDTENTRETRKIFKSLSENFDKLAGSISNLEKSLVSTIEGVAKGATLFGLATLLLDPETFFEWVEAAVKMISDFASAIQGIMMGDVGSLFEFIEEYTVAFALGLTYILAKVAALSGTIAAIGSLFLKIGKGLVAVLKWSRILLGLPGLIIGFVIGIVGGLMAAYEAWQEGAGILDILKAFIGGFFDATIKPLFDAFEWVAKKIAEITESVVDFFSDLNPFSDKDEDVERIEKAQESLQESREQQAAIMENMAKEEEKLAELQDRLATASDEKTLFGLGNSEREDILEEMNDIRETMSEKEARLTAARSRERSAMEELGMDPDAVTPQSSRPVVPPSNNDVSREEEAMQYFIDQGYTPEQAAGIVGNLMAESNLDTRAVGDSGKAHGIAQWHPDRQAMFEEQFGKPVLEGSFQEQLAFIDWEMNNNEKRAREKLEQANTPEQAAYLVDKYYERSKGLHTDRRMDNAGKLMDKYGDLEPGSPLMTDIPITEQLRAAQENNTALVGEVAAAQQQQMASMNTKISNQGGSVSNNTQNITQDYSPDLLARSFITYPVSP